MSKFVLNDVRFCLGIEKVDGIIHAEQGIPLFYCEERGIIARLPFAVRAEDYEQPVSVYMYSGTREILRKRGRDDILVNKIGEDDIDLLTDFNFLEEALEEEKIRRIPKVMSSYVSVMLTTIAAVVCFLLRAKWGYLLPISVACLVVAIGSFFYARNLTRVMNSDVIYDCDGRWVNLSTGETNLDGGYKLQLNREETAL